MQEVKIDLMESSEPRKGLRSGNIKNSFVFHSSNV